LIGLQVMQMGLNITPPVQPVLAGLGLGIATFFIVSHLTWSQHAATKPALD
jgi:hypothetical protein